MEADYSKKLKEFNPTWQNKLDLEEAIGVLNGKKSRLGLDKSGFQDQLAEISATIRSSGHLPHDQYKALTMKQVEIKRNIRRIDLSILDLKDEIRTKNHLRERIEQHLKNSGTYDNSLINDLEEMKVKYTEFASDATRVSSTRIMASKFVDEIDTILKRNI